MHYVNGKNNNHSNYNISRFLCKQIQILQTMTVRETYEWLVKYFFFILHTHCTECFFFFASLH